MTLYTFKKKGIQKFVRLLLKNTMSNDVMAFYL